MMRAGSRRASRGIARGYLDNGYEGYGRRRRRSKSRTPIVAVTAGAASVAVIAGAVVGAGHLFSAQSAANAAAVPNTNCTLIVPANPLTAQGLATPYQLTATDPAAGPCNEANANQTAFVQGAVLDPATGQISVYNPLVIDAGTQAAVTPTVPTLPAGAVVGIWFGFNGTTLSFEGADQAGGTAATATATATAASTRGDRRGYADGGGHVNGGPDRHCCHPVSNGGHANRRGHRQRRHRGSHDGGHAEREHRHGGGPGLHPAERPSSRPGERDGHGGRHRDDGADELAGRDGHGRADGGRHLVGGRGDRDGDRTDGHRHSAAGHSQHPRGVRHAGRDPAAGQLRRRRGHRRHVLVVHPGGGL